jgi:hypothetical protein
MAKDDDLSRTVRGLRFELVMAVCAPLISTLATGASWRQVRVLQAQTQVLQEQLGAQVWPYISVSATGDGVPKSNFIAIMHAVLGPKLVARSARGVAQ